MLTVTEAENQGEPVLRLAGVLSIYTAAQARDELRPWLERREALTLDLSGVEEFDTAGVQLLLWLKREAAQRGVTLALVLHSPAVVEVLDLLKVTGLFGDPILIAPHAS